MSTVVVCVGDSITRGQVSSNWVKSLEKRLGPKGFTFTNAGGNGQLAWNVRLRLDAVIALDPDVVTLLIGTNDVNATYSPALTKMYTKQQKLPAVPTLSWYVENVTAIVDRLQGETHARITLIEIPILGEDLTSEMNARVRSYNAALHQIAESHGISVLPLYDLLAAQLTPGATPPVFEANYSWVMRAALQHTFLFQSWVSISRHNGLELLTDNVHLNDRAAGIVADMVEQVLRETVR